ncbi:hypothetical protein ACKVV1_011002 [Pyricularia oryzae]
MRSSAILTTAIHLCGVYALSRRDEIVEQAAARTANQYIVEYKTSELAARDVEASLTSLEGIAIRSSFDSPIFQGASVEVADGLDVKGLAALPNVARVWRNEIVALEEAAPGEFFPDDAAAIKYDVYSATGVDRLHAAGILGQGVKVGVIDTGVAYRHPALGGGFGPGFKVAGGWDFVGNGAYPSDPKKPDADPDDQRGHGTHVAGIVAGAGKAWTGVAPNATIFAYKVMGTLDVTDVETLIEALLRAYDDGMDVITISISTPAGGGFADIAWAEVASRIVEQGTVVTMSADNRGDRGLFWIGDGASGRNVIAVASVDANSSASAGFALDFHAADGTKKSVVSGYIGAPKYWPSTIRDWPVIPMNFNTSDPADGCQPYPTGTRNLTNTIPLIRRGTCKFAVKLGHLGALGAQYVMIYNNDDPLLDPATDDAKQTMGLVTAETGKAIIEAVQAGGNVTASFTLDPESPVGMPNPSGGRPSIFTSWGPLYDLTPKPEIAAPGGLIFSTYLNGGYLQMSGTSMATPYVAATAALYIGVHGGGDRSSRPTGFAAQVRRRIITSGVALPWSDGSETDFGMAASVAQVGNGLVNAYKVVKYDTVVDSEPLALKDTANFKGEQKIVVRNGGSSAVTYTVSMSAAGGFEMFNAQGQVKKFTEISPLAMEVDAQVPEPFVLQAGEEKTITVTFANPSSKGWNAKALPTYNGKVLISGSNGEQLSVPYLGMASDLEAEMYPIWATGFPFSKSGTGFVDIKDKAYYTFNLSRTTQDFPKIFTSLRYGSDQVRWDIFEAGWTETSWTWPLVPGTGGYIGPVAEWTQDANYIPGQHNASLVTALPRPAGDRHAAGQFFWLGKLGHNGSQIAPGNYTMRFAALRPFADPAKSESWSLFKTPEIQVRPCPGCVDLP